MKDFFESEEYKEIVMKAAEQSCRDMKWTVIKAEILKEFDDKYPEIFKFIEDDIIDEVRDFISNSIDKALSARDEEWREKIEDCLDLIVGYQSDLCENSQEFRSLVVFELNEIIKDHRS